MSAYYGVMLVPEAHKNALNVLVANLVGDDPAASMNMAVPANATGVETDEFTHWYGGRYYTLTELMIFQTLTNNIPALAWPVNGVYGPVTLAQVQAAIAASTFTVITRDVRDTQMPGETLDAALSAAGLKQIVWS